MSFPTITERFGSLSATGLAKEVTFGTPVAATTWQPMTGNGMEEDPGWFSPELMAGWRDLHVFNLQGEAKFVGSLNGLLFPSNAMALIVASIGTDSVSGTTSPYTHTVSQALTLPSLTVEKDIGGYQSLQFAGNKVGKLTLKAAAGNEAVTVAADMSAQSVAILDSPTAISVVNELPYTFAECTATMFGTARYEVSSAEVSIDNGLKETWTFSGSHGPSFISPVTLHVSGAIDLVWSSLDDSTYGDFTKLKNQTLGAFQLAVTHPSGGSFGTTINCPQVVYTKYTNDLKISDVVMSSLTYEASRSLSSNYTIQATVVNGVSTGY